MTVSASLQGFPELQRELGKLGREATQKASLRRAVRRSVEPTAEIMRGMAPRASGALAISIGIGTRLAKRQQAQHRRMFRDDRAAVEMFVGPSYNLGAGGRHGHLLEFGTINMAPQPFVRPAWDQDKDAVLARMKAEIWADIQRTVARAERRAARLAARG